MTTHATDEWMAQFNCGGGAPALDCICGITHVAIDSPDLDEDERARYTAMAGDRIALHHGVDSITEHTFAGMTVVDDCECGRMARIEQMITRERDFILGYFRARALKAESEAASIRAALATQHQEPKS